MVGRPKGAIHVDRTIDAATLRDLLKPIYEKLSKAGIPAVRLPTNEALISLVVDWVDDEKVKEWIRSYVASMG